MILIMIFLHIVDDFYLQGWLANAKQKQWWEDNAPQEMYKNDYKWALLIHSFSWSFMIMLPILIANGFSNSFYIIFALNMIIHMFTDDLKANKREINLIQDQLIHITQIIVTLLFFLR